MHDIRARQQVVQQHFDGRALSLLRLTAASRVSGSLSSVELASASSCGRSITTKPSGIIVASDVPLAFTYNRSPTLHDVFPPPASTIWGSAP
jgi:hypothetical protein